MKMQHVVKLVCKDGAKLITYYADSEDDAKSYVAEMAKANTLTYVIDLEETDHAAADAFWQNWYEANPDD